MRRTFVTKEANLTIDTRAFQAATSPADRIVVPVEGTDEEFVAQEWAVQMAASNGLNLRAVHVTSMVERVPKDMFLFVRRLASKWGVSLETKVLEGDPIPEILRELGPRDLVVIGTRRMAAHYHVGSVTEALIRSAPCPVQVVRIP